MTPEEFFTICWRAVDFPYTMDVSRFGSIANSIKRVSFWLNGEYDGMLIGTGKVRHSVFADDSACVVAALTMDGTTMRVEGKLGAHGLDAKWLKVPPSKETLIKLRLYGDTDPLPWPHIVNFNMLRAYNVDTDEVVQMKISDEMLRKMKEAVEEAITKDVAAIGISQFRR